MIRFIDSIKKKYSRRYFARGEQWPPAKRDKLINLQLIETSRADSFSSSTSEDVRRTPLHHADIFLKKEGMKYVKKVLVEGHAGIGKTTLSLMLSEEWAQGKIFQQFNCVLLLPLREKKVAAASSLLDLLRLLHANESIRSAVAIELEANEGEGLLIIADGWDELNEAARSKDSFLYDLLFGDIVPFASVLVTSRPSASSDIRNLPQIDRLIAVMGFDKEDVKAYIKSEYKNDIQKYSQLLKRIESNPLLQSVCCIPLNCVITCHLWEVFHEELPSTMTTLYTQIILSIVYRSIKKYKEYDHILSLDNFSAIPENLQPVWQQLCEFAFNRITSNQVVFSMEELENVLPEILTSDPKLSAFGLLQLSSSLLPVGHGLSASFLHLTFQEYLAALHISTLPAQQLISLCETYGASSHFAMVWRFLFGLLSSNSLKAESHEALSIEEIVLNLLQAFGKSSKSSCSLLLCHCAFEYQDQHVTAFIAELLNNLINGNFPVSHNALDCAAICKVIAETVQCQSLTLCMNGCDIEDSGLEWLTEPLSKANGFLKVKHLDVAKNKISSVGIYKLFTRASFAFSSLEQLCLSNNKIDAIGINAIFSLATWPGYRSLTRLNLSDNPIGPAGLKELENAVLADSVPKLYSLDLSNTFTLDAKDNSLVLASLTEALAIKCCRLMALDLSRNVLGVPGAEVLGRIMSRQTKYISEFDLFLNDTQLGDDGLVAFVESLLEVCNLYFFGIKQNGIHHVGLSRLVEKLCSGRLNCVVLDLVGNPLGSKGTIQLSLMMSYKWCTTEYLLLSSCELTSPAHLPEIMKSSSLMQKSSITSLGLSGNCFSGERISFLISLVLSCVSNLKTLDTSNCQLTSNDLKSFLFAIHNCLPATTLKQWHLSNNEVNDTGAATLISLFDSLFPRLHIVDVNGNPISICVKANLQRCCRRNQKVLARFAIDSLTYIQYINRNTPQMYMYHS